MRHKRGGLGRAEALAETGEFIAKEAVLLFQVQDVESGYTQGVGVEGGL